MNILSSIQQTGRFLRFMDNQWIVISDGDARQKIAHAIQYRIRNDLSQPLSGVITSDPLEPTSSTSAIEPNESAETKTLEVQEEYQWTKNFQQPIKLPTPMTTNQMCTSDLRISSQDSTGEQEQEQTYRHKNVHPESQLEQFDVPQPLQDFSPLYVQATSTVPSVSDVAIENRSFSPFPAFTERQPLNSFTHEGQRAVSEYIHWKSYEDFQINEAQQHHCLHRNTLLSHTIQNMCVSTNHDPFPSSSMNLDASFDPLPLQQQHSFSSTDIGEKVSPPIFLASESSLTMDTFIESGDSTGMAKQLVNEVVPCPDLSSCCLSSLSNHPNHNVRQGYEATTAENIMQQLQQIGALPMNNNFISHPKHRAKATDVGYYNSALSLLSTVSKHQQEISSAESEVLEPGLCYISSKSLDDFTSAPVPPVEPIEASPADSNYQI